MNSIPQAGKFYKRTTRYVESLNFRTTMQANDKMLILYSEQNEGEKTFFSAKILILKTGVVDYFVNLDCHFFEEVML